MTAIPALGRIIARFLSTRGEHCAVRTVLRHRSELVMTASQHVQHMHKALTQMNLQIHHVISDITGTTGLAIVAGQRDAAELAKLRDPHIKAHAETIRKSLVGNWRSEHLFTLKPKHAVCVRKPKNSLGWTCGW